MLGYNRLIMTTKKVKTWLGGDTCDLCKKKVSTHKFFYDAKMKFGQWALLCSPCFDLHGIRLGLGFGQKYDSTTKEKVEG